MMRWTQLRPVSLRVSVTDRCQLRCLYCMPPGEMPELSHHEILSFEEIIRLVRVLKRHFGLSKIHITGGEPLLREGIIQFVAMLARERIGDLTLTTNGQLLAAMASDLKRAGLRRVNISLDSLNAETFRWLTRGGELRRTVTGIDSALRCGLAPVKLNVAVLRNVNSDEPLDIARFGLERGCQVRFLELMPIGPAARRFEALFVPSAEVIAKLGEAFDLRPAPARPGVSSRSYIARDRDGREGIIGFISSRTAPFCDDCRRLRLTAAGRLIGCLARGEGPNIRPFLRNSDPPDTEQLAEAVRDALRLKRNGRRFTTASPMAGVGG